MEDERWEGLPKVSAASDYRNASDVCRPPLEKIGGGGGGGGGRGGHYSLRGDIILRWPTESFLVRLHRSPLSDSTLTVHRSPFTAKRFDPLFTVHRSLRWPIWPFPAADLYFPTSYFQLLTSTFLLPTSSFVLLPSNFQLLTSRFFNNTLPLQLQIMRMRKSAKREVFGCNCTRTSSAVLSLSLAVTAEMRVSSIIKLFLGAAAVSVD